MTKKFKFFTVTVVTGLLLIGCGGGDGSSATTASATTQTAYLIDSPVDGIDVVCGNTTSVTDTNGILTYDPAKCTQLSFKLGNLTLGSIATSAIKVDRYITLQELAGKTRSDINDSTVLKMAVLLQSLDDDNNVTNGIKITTTVKNTLGLTGAIADKNDTEISTAITTAGKTQRDAISSFTHLLTQTKLIDSNITATMFRVGNIIVDTTTGLQWQDDSAAATYTADWATAGAYCSAMTLDGVSGWRLPTLAELLGIIDRNKISATAIASGFTNANSGYYWSSTEYSSTSADYVRFDGYGWSMNFKTSGYYVRCVR
jgi:hypothetical protein